MPCTAKPRRTGRSMRRLGGAVLASAAVAAACAIDPDELACEEAVAYYEGCCAADGVGFVCGGRGCNAGLTLREDESACILAAECSELVASGVCERVRALSQAVDAAADAGTSVTARDAVCP